MISLYTESIACLLIFVACVTHLNRMRTRSFKDWVAFALTAAGAAGKAAYAVWPAATLGDAYWDGMFFVGIAYIAVTQFMCERRTLRAPERFTQVV